MNLKGFYKIVAGILLCLMVVNIPLNLTFEALKERHYITQKSMDGFSTWDLHLTPQSQNAIAPPDELFPYETESPETISTYQKVIVLIGSSVVAGDGVKRGDRFSNELSRISSASSVPTYFFNAGRSGSEIYTYFTNLKELIKKYPKIQCLIWFPNRNDLISQAELQTRLSEKQEAKNLSSASTMPLQDMLFLGFFKRLGQRFTFEGNILKENSIQSEHNLYYTTGLMEGLDSETKSDLAAALQSYKEILDAHGTHFSAVFLPSRHFNRFHQWSEAKSLLDVQALLNDQGITNISFFEQVKEHDDYVDYIHFSPVGHSMIAKLLQERMSELCPDSAKK